MNYFDHRSYPNSPENRIRMARENQSAKPVKFAKTKKALKFIAIGAGAIGVGLAVAHFAHIGLVYGVFPGLDMGLTSTLKVAFHAFSQPAQLIGGLLGENAGFVALGFEAIGTAILGSKAIYAIKEKFANKKQQQRVPVMNSPQAEQTQFSPESFTQPQQEPRPQNEEPKSQVNPQSNEAVTTRIMDNLNKMRQLRSTSPSLKP